LEIGDGLTEMQKDIYNYIKAQGSVTHEQIMQQLGLSKLQLEKNFATLRHCELFRASRETGQILLTIW
jgi:predicted HTH transcriptional regulator